MCIISPKCISINHVSTQNKYIIYIYASIPLSSMLYSPPYPIIHRRVYFLKLTTSQMYFKGLIK